MNRKSLIAYLLCGLFLLASPFLTQRWNSGGSQAVIVWDISGYYLYLPSLFYDDLGKLNNYDYIQKTYHPASDAKDMAFVQPNTGKYVMNYPCGMAIMNLPAFAVGHIAAKIGGYPIDGFSLPYQVAVQFWCILFSLIGLWFLRKVLLRYFDDWLVGLLLAIVCFATNYYDFVSFVPLTHAYLFTLYALIIYFTDTFYKSEKPRLFYIVLIGLLSGLATISRPTEIICVFIPLLWGIGSVAQLKDRVRFLVGNISVPVSYALCALIAALPQLIYWKIYAGHWLFFSYHGDDKTFSFLRPHIEDVLISYKKGWLMYTPVMVLSILGFYPLYRHYRQTFGAIFIFALINLYLVSAWDCWWYGGSFSMRALIQSYPLMLFPMGAFVDSTLRNKIFRYPVAMFLLFCTWLNLVMHYQANAGGIIDGENETKRYYWRTFGKTKIKITDRKLLDTNEEMPMPFEPSLKEIYRNDFERYALADTVMAQSGKHALMLDQYKQWTEKISIPVAKGINKGWYRVYASVYFPEMEWNVWAQTQFVIALSKDAKEMKSNMIRIQRITVPEKWQEVYADILVPQQPCDSLHVYFWNADGHSKIFIDDIKVSYTPEQ